MKDYSVQLAFRCQEDVITRVEYIANKAGLTRSEVIRNLVLMGLEDAELLDKIGAIKGYKYFKMMIEAVGKEANEKGEI